MPKIDLMVAALRYLQDHAQGLINEGFNYVIIINHEGTNVQTSSLSCSVCISEILTQSLLAFLEGAEHAERS